MTALKSLLGWIARHGILFVALIGAILLYRSADRTLDGFRGLRANAEALAQGEGPLLAGARAALAGGDADAGGLHRLGRGQIDARLADARRRRDAAAGACGSDLSALMSGGAEAVIANRRRCITGTLAEREVVTLGAMRAGLDARRPGETSAAALARHAAIAERAAGVAATARSRLAAVRGDYVPDALQRRDVATYERVIARMDAVRDTAGRQAAILRAQQRATDAASVAARARVAAALDAYRRLAADRTRALSDNGVRRAQAWAVANDLSGVARQAALALLLIVATPYLIRLFCYFVLAPIAMRRAAIRVAVPGAGVPVPPSERSATSVAVRLGEGEELLVRHGYLQTTSVAGAKATQWLLDARYPVMSLVTGLTLLSRIRGAGETTTVSAVRDPLAEVCVMDLPEGASCILQPRALAAVVQPVGRPLRVRSHWRIGSLNAWLTLQLRYLVFTGPARLVLKGGRGVRVERAERGRVFGQDQLLGFSADLAYSVTRNETLLPYLLGREPLLKDRVEAGTGVLVVEEAPLAGRRGGVRHGIEGMIDAGLKIFGM